MIVLQVDSRTTHFNVSIRGLALNNTYPNTIISSLKASIDWQILLDRYVSAPRNISHNGSILFRCVSVGSSSLIALLGDSTSAVFTPLPNSCYLQISGTPLCDLKPNSTLMEVKGAKKPSLRGFSEKSKRSRNCKRSRGGGKAAVAIDNAREEGASDEIDATIDDDDEVMWREAGGDLPLAAFDTSILLPLPRIMPVNAKRLKLGASLSLPQLMPPQSVNAAATSARQRQPLSATATFTNVVPIIPLRRAASAEMISDHTRKYKIRKLKARQAVVLFCQDSID